MRICQWCKKELTGASTKKFCGGACRTAASKARKSQPDASETKACQWCGEHFQPKTKRAQFCTDKCRNEHHQAQKSAPVLREGKCAHCSGTFFSPRKTRKYCNDECRVDAYFKSLDVAYTSDEDYVQLRNWWLYKYRTDAELYEAAYGEMKAAEEALEDFDLTFYEDEDDENAAKEELEDEYWAAKDAYEELIKTRSIDFEAVKRGRQKLRDIYLRQKLEAQYEAHKAVMKELSDSFSND